MEWTKADSLRGRKVILVPSKYDFDDLESRFAANEFNGSDPEPHYTGRT